MKRRTVLAGVAGVAAVGGVAYAARNPIARSVITSANNEQVRLTQAPLINSNVCTLSPEQVEGPFFFSAPVRRDITEDRSGVPLDLTLQVVRADDCQTLYGARVEVWHCDAAGRYSGYREDLSRHPFETMVYLGGQEHVEPENEKTFLRGAQETDYDGIASFTTILPGWYEPRITHIHVKVYAGDRAYLTSQLYFPQDLVAGIYRDHADYAPHGEMPYHLRNDPVLGNFPDGGGLLLDPQWQADRLVASAVLGLG